MTEPVRYQRLGDETGMFVRFDRGFGLNVHVGIRERRWEGNEVRDRELLVLGIGGWERLCELVDEWRARQAADNDGRWP